MQNFVELNRYVYTTNNPISFRDPSGFSSISIDYGSTLGTISAPALGGLPPLGFKTGVIILGSIAVLLATVETATHLFAKKSDLKQVRAAGLAAGISPGCLKEWGKFVEQAKQSGFFGSANDRGDFTWGELLDLAEEFLDLFPRCRSG
jgi:hypothetical protein